MVSAISPASTRTSSNPSAPAPPASCRLDHVAEQLAGRQIARAHQGGQRKGQRHQQAEACRFRQGQRIDAERQIESKAAGEQRGGDEGRGSTDGKPDDDAAQRQQHDEAEIDRKDGAGRGAQAFQDGDRPGLGVEKGANRIAHPHAADQKRAQSHHGQEQCRAVDEALEAEAGILETTDAPAGIGKALLQTGKPGFCVEPRRVGDAIDLIDQAAGPHQARALQAFIGHHQPRTEDEGIAAAIGLAGDDCADLVILRADARDLSHRYAQALQQFAVGDRAPMTLAERQHIGKLALGRQIDRAEQRIGMIDGFQLDQLTLIGYRRFGHGAQRAQCAHAARRHEGLQCGRIGRAIEQAQLDIAAKQRLGVAVEAGAHRFRQRAHAGNECCTQRQAEQKQPETAQAPAQLAGCEAERQRQR